MIKQRTILLLLSVIILGQSISLSGQVGNTNTNLRELPIVLTWDDTGIRIASKTSNNHSTNLIHVTPSQFIDQIGNDLIQVTPSTKNTPVIIEVSNFFKAPAATVAENKDFYPNLRPKIDIHMPKLALSNYNEPNSFIIELQNFSDDTDASKQTFLFRGLDVFFVVADNCAKLSSDQNRITVDVKKCKVKHLLLKGGLLNLEDIDKKVPDLCRRYNERYFSYGQPDAFVCLEDCKETDPDAITNLKHSRKLITKYNITDFEDKPISFLGDLLLTKQGVGFNLKVETAQVSKARGRNKSQRIAYEAYDEYRFFPWYEFINLSFSKYIDERQLMITDPYNNSYIYNSNVHFSNVELIQFFNELRALISSNVN